MECQEDKESTGSSHYRSISEITSPASPLKFNGLKDRKKLEKEDSYIGSSSWAFDTKDRLGFCNDCIQDVMPNLLDQRLQKNTWSKRIQEFQNHSLNTEPNDIRGIRNTIGIKYGNSLQEETYCPSLLQYVFHLTVPCFKSLLTIATHFRKLDPARYTGVRLEQVSRGELGKKQEHLLILRILGPNSGVAIAVKNMLLLMNFEEELMWDICSDGWTDIHVTWKSKDRQNHLKRKRTGSPQTSSLDFGTLNWTMKQ